MQSLFFNFRRYDLGRVGRYKLNKALGDVAAKLKIELPAEGGENPRESRVISRNDIVAIIGKLIELNNGRGEPATTSTTSATGASAPTAS